MPLYCRYCWLHGAHIPLYRHYGGRDRYCCTLRIIVFAIASAGCRCLGPFTLCDTQFDADTWDTYHVCYTKKISPNMTNSVRPSAVHAYHRIINQCVRKGKHIWVIRVNTHTVPIFPGQSHYLRKFRDIWGTIVKAERVFIVMPAKRSLHIQTEFFTVRRATYSR